MSSSLGGLDKARGISFLFLLPIGPLPWPPLLLDIATALATKERPEKVAGGVGGGSNACWEGMQPRSRSAGEPSSSSELQDESLSEEQRLELDDEPEDDDEQEDEDDERRVERRDR